MAATTSDLSSDSSEEKGLLGGSSSRRAHRRYGSTTVNMKKPEHVLRHRVTKQDTIQGIALRYGVTMALVKQHNKLFSSEAMFLHDYLEVPVSKEVFDSFEVTNSCPPTPLPNGRLRSSVESTESDKNPPLDPLSALSSPIKVTAPSSHLPNKKVSTESLTCPSKDVMDYSDTRPSDFLSKIDCNIAVMKTSIQKMERSNKYPVVPKMAQMELEVNPDSHRKKSQKASHRTDSNGFPTRNGSAMKNGFGGGFNVNKGYVCDPDDMDGAVFSPTSPPSVAVVGGQHSPPHKMGANGKMTMSLQRLMREQEDACPL